MNRTLQFVLAVTPLVVALSASAAEPINTFGKGGGLFGGPPRTGVAIKGADTVAYFTDGKLVQGKDEFTTEWKGAKWKFASQDHLDKFKSNPEQYAPQYGGYCAYGAAQGYLVKIEPEEFMIVDGKLYLNYDADVSDKFKKDPKGFITKADAQFQKLLDKK